LRTVSIAFEVILTLMLELGHESLAVTQDYLADVRKPGEAKKAVTDADFIPKPKRPKAKRRNLEEVVEFGRRRPFPAYVELLLDESGVVGFALRFQRLLQTKKRSRIARVAV
jgi:hypothetical protein